MISTPVSHNTGNSQVAWRNWGIPSTLLGIPKLCGEIGEFPHTGNSRVVWRNWGIPNNILGIPKFCEAFWEFPVHDWEFPLTSVESMHRKMYLSTLGRVPEVSAEWKDWDEKRFEEALEGAEGIQTTEPGSEGQESATTPQCEEDPTLMPSPRAPDNPLMVPEVHNQAPTVPPAQTAIVPIDTGAIPPPAQQPPVQQAPPAPNKRGRKRKALADTNQAFVNSTAVTGTNGKIAMQTTKRRKRWDSGLSKEEAQRVRNERKENKQTAARG
ncbi:hypothetical protein K435DRAFT_798273 [Dendrothele bispora CBS 962.96]|uniref:Uncharacterized protein n=1 Tax=Dendrothele bispora (strain CBS 962.96) TaxID=1314807 RepID=A0A4S8LZU0_DENBC|nr:hypothetical protein K435DRAFT_798273 [Dendrothele bispora CBS 962.96]